MSIILILFLTINHLCAVCGSSRVFAACIILQFLSGILGLQLKNYTVLQLLQPGQRRYSLFSSYLSD